MMTEGQGSLVPPVVVRTVRAVGTVAGGTVRRCSAGLLAGASGEAAGLASAAGLVCILIGMMCLYLSGTWLYYLGMISVIFFGIGK